MAPPEWLEGGGRLEAGRRHELLVVIRPDKRYQI
jgi:hypothetical protein